VSQLHDLTALEQRDHLRSKQISSVELTEHYLARIERHGEDLGAFVTLTPELAQKEAADADRRLADGDRAPLLGLPLAFKDLHPVAGVRTTFGSRALADLVPPTNGHVVGLLRDAGVVTVGTTHAPEFGPTCFTHTSLVGRPAVTPYDVTRYASGSSGGSAAAVAAGLLPFGHASDGAGSTRTPAAVCGLVGIKPSRGRLSSAPSGSFISWGTEGPLGRTVADAALMLDVMAKTWAGDLYGRETTASFLETLDTAPERLRVLRFTDSGLGDSDPAVVEAVDQAARLLTDLGHVVVDGSNPVPWDEQLQGVLQVLFSGAVSASARMVPADRHHLLEPYTRWCLEEVVKHDAGHFIAAQAVLGSAAARLLAAVAEYDVVLSPVSSRPAVPVGWFEENGTGEECGRRMLEWSAFTPWANFTGQPAVSLPLHVTPEGLPVGVQLAASRIGDDHLLLQLAAQLQRAAPFAHRHPPQWSH
jgi:amidase